ncbi:unnamed protein product [Schistocephalus solidus]|uniref:Reverse transcriptase domain-containing protein n=1 Tax=Schistocephalus solidus TaxID=70667 RepID=A0A183T6U7_SCHSO|nr:unnamed protein product [Schistocephalus solidus]
MIRQTIDRLPQVDTNNDLGLPPSIPETIRAVQQIYSGKAPGSNVIPPQVYKLVQGLLLESQCGFHRHRATTDMNFATRQLQEKCQEMRAHLYTTFVDLTKAFDTVNRDGLWKVMQKFGCPERFTHMVRQRHDGITAHVTDNGTVSEAFAVANGVKQGWILASNLFSLMFSAMLMDAYHNEQPGIRLAYRTDGHLLNSWHMQASTRVSTTTVHDLLFADDYARTTVMEEDMQRSMDLFAAVCAEFELTISRAKTVVRIGEKSAKVMKALMSMKRKLLCDAGGPPLMVELYGHWQVEDYIPPVAENGVVPRNEDGKLELFKSSMLPLGSHLSLRIMKPAAIDTAVCST